MSILRGIRGLAALNCLDYGLGEGTIARLDAGECMRMTEARTRELEGLGHR